MNPQTFLLLSIPVCLMLALIATSASYFCYTIEPFIVEARIVYRGWPLYWMIEPIARAFPLEDNRSWKRAFTKP